MSVSKTVAQHLPQNKQLKGNVYPEIQQFGVCTDDVTMFTIELKKGYYEEMHRHIHEQVIYLVKGCMRVTFKDQPPVDVKAGDFIWLPSNVDHDALAVEDLFAVEVFHPARREIFKTPSPDV